MFLLLTPFVTYGKTKVDSHLRVWNAQEVVTHFEMQADIVEIDISSLEDPELKKVFGELKNYPQQFLCLHLKGFTKTNLRG